MWHNLHFLNDHIPLHLTGRVNRGAARCNGAAPLFSVVLLLASNFFVTLRGHGGKDLDGNILSLLKILHSFLQFLTDPERTKPEHLYSSQGPLSSIRAAIKRTRTNSQGDNTRERRRPEITIISAEPLVSNNWFSGGSVVFHPSQSGWSAGIQAVSQPPPSYDQVIKEKTQEVHIVKPTAAPRRTTCTASSATQTESVGENTASQSSASPVPAERKPAGKKPQKPPRPSLPKAKVIKPSTDRGGEVAKNTSALTSTEHQSDAKSDVEQYHTCTRSVTVYWDIPTNHHSVTVVPIETTSSNSQHGQRPIPRPRTKTHKQTKEEEGKVQTLVKLSEDCENTESDFQEISTNKYLKELLEVFSGAIECEESSDIAEQSDESFQGENAVGEMSTNHNQRNIRARIQAFESQAGSEEGDGLESAKPEPLPRKATTKPPVASKPSVAFKPKRNDDNNQNIPTTQNPTPAPRPQPPKKPVGYSVREELETLHSKGALPPRSHPSVLTRANAIHEEEPSPIPPAPPVKPSKEPLKPNLNINNHNSASMFRENKFEDSPSNNIAVRTQYNVDSSGTSFTRQSVTRRPTTIRVPSKTGLDHFQDSPPPLPVQKPIGSLNSSANPKESSTPPVPFQNWFSTGPEPSLPPRKPSVNKTLPPRPPPAKTGPGRPPPPGESAGRSQAASRQPSPKPQEQKSQRRGLVLPPRPSPGHRLYNKYTLQLPHGIAAVDYNGSNTGELSFQKSAVLLLLEKIDQNEFECQVGEIRGRVHKSRMKIITPLGSYSPPPQVETAPASSGGNGNGLKVQAVCDFIQEGPGELGLRAGDVATEVEKVDSQWYRGTCRGSTGFFPINFVKVLSNSPKPLPERKARPKSAPVSGPRCVARFDFEGEHSDELSFSEGEVIQLKEYVGDDWAQGQNGISIGIFPLNFVEVIEDLPLPPCQQQSNRIALPGMAAAAPSKQSVVTKPAQAPESSVEWVVALYDYAAKTVDDLSFQQGDCILITRHLSEEWSFGRLNGREGMFPMSFVEATTVQQTSDNQHNEGAGGTRARALFDFTSDCDEELSLQVGDTVTNLESIDDEWFLGDLRGKRALVPKNYVQLL
ncbi:SH3 domain-containing protein 19 [Odontesthes bonariensis]|uniref:SH3 domain-containing protein 19 n=1 Tax=Odontesthes bonariensis TaxID=219752 RepID=UPI003F58F73D